MKELFGLALMILLSTSGCGSSSSSSRTPAPVQQKEDAAAFEAWTNLKGTYSLKTVDGVDLPDDPDSEIRIENDRYTTEDKSHVTLLNLGLYHGFSTSGALAWNLGPMKEIGQSSVISDKGRTTLIYDCKEETLNFEGRRYVVSLHVEATEIIGSQNITVRFTLVSPEFGDSSNHTYILSRTR